MRRPGPGIRGQRRPPGHFGAPEGAQLHHRVTLKSGMAGSLGSGEPGAAGRPRGRQPLGPTELSAPRVPSPDRSRCSPDWRCEPAELLEHCEERSDARTPTKRGLARAQPTGIKCDPQAPSREMHQALEKTLQGAASKDSPVPRSLALRLWVQHLTPHPAQL